MKKSKLAPVRSTEERNRLFLENENLVGWLIYQKSPTLKSIARKIGHDDAVQIGSIGLLRACETWNPQIGRFSTWGCNYIRWHLLRAWKLTSRQVPVDWESEIPYEKLWDCRFGNADRCLGHIPPEALGKLTYREREVIKLRYGLGDGYTYTLEEVGRIFKVTRERVRQIEIRAIRKMRDPLVVRLLASMADARECGVCGQWTVTNEFCGNCDAVGCASCVRGWKECPKCRKERECQEATEREDRRAWKRLREIFG